MNPFVPTDFVVPLRVQDPDFTIRPLLISDVVKDYDAVMTSQAICTATPSAQEPSGPKASASKTT